MSSQNQSDTHQNKWKDITSFVEECAASLTHAKPMLCTESFSLQDSMAAMELLDPKMDSCEVPASQIVQSVEENSPDDKTLYPRPAPTKIDDDFSPLPWDDLSLRDAAFIAVEALVRLESMLGGAAVVESTYTCLYAHCAVMEDMKSRLDPPSETLTEKFEKLLNSSSVQTPRGTPPQHVIYATSLALIEITEIMRSIILHGDIYEEEDFSANTYNITVFSDRERGSTLSELTYALRLVEEIEEQDSEGVQCVVLLLEFLLDLLNVMTNVARVAGSKVMEVMAETKEMVQAAVHKINDLQKVFRRLQQNQSQREVELLQRTFDPYVNRPLFGNSPVRKVVFLEPKESLPILSNYISQIDWALCDLVLQGDTLSRIRRFLDKLSKSSINILTRSLIVLNLYFDDKLLGKSPLLEVIVKNMQEMTDVPDEIFETKHGQIFLNRLAKPLYDTLKLKLLNRNRQRAYLEAVILADWSQLQQEAHVVDMHYRKERNLDSSTPPYMSHYVLSNLVELMDLYVSIGVELSLFQGQEDLAIVYWYRDFLLSTVLNNLQAMQRIKLAVKAAEQQSHHKGKKKHYGKKDKNGNSQHADQKDLEYEFDLMLFDLKRNLCRGVVRFVACMRQAGILSSKSFQFTTPEKNFAKRFEVFTSIQQPPPLSYDDFRSGSDFSKVSQQDLLFSTSECFKAGKATVDKLQALLPNLDAPHLGMTKEELGNIAKVCVGNLIYVQKLKQVIESKEVKTASVAFDFDANSEFCTIKIS